MQYYIPKMLPEHVEVEPDVFQPYSDATVAGWRNEQRLATQQGKHQRAGVTQMVLLADKLQIAESVPLYPYLVRLGDVVQVPVRSLKPRRASIQCSFGIKRPASLAGCTF